MNKESIFELQKIDCNCNDCKFMVRDFDAFKISLDKHYKWQLDYFTKTRDNLIGKANEWKSKGDTFKYDLLMIEAKKMRFQFDKAECRINYGNCSKFNKPVSFIPETCQLETQNCFVHRKEL